MGHGTETEGSVGRGTGDGTKWEGEAPAEPKTAASSEWRVASSERRLAISDW
jgi:hypothetical protein